MTLWHRGPWLCTLIMVVSAPLSSQAVDVLRLADGDDPLQLAPHVEVLEDPSRRLTIADVLRPENARRFVANHTDTLNLGLSRSAFWLRFAVAATDRAVAFDWLVDLGRPFMDSVEFYAQADRSAPGSAGWVVERAGDMHSHLERSDWRRPLYFHLGHLDTQPTTYYLRVENAPGLYLPIGLKTHAQYTAQTHLRVLWVGIYAGVILLAVLYNLLLFVSLRDRSYLWYVLYVSLLSLYFLKIQGIYTLFDGDGYGDWVGAMALLGGSILFMIAFARSFLLTRRNAPHVDLLLRVAFMISAGLLALVPVLDRLLVINLYSLWGMVLPFPLIASGVICYRRGFVPARFFILAWGAFCTGGLFFAATYRGLLPYTPLGFYGFQIGSAIEAVLLSLALGDRIRILHRAKRNAEAASAAKSQFLANVSHEIRTPLNGVLAMIELLKGTKLDAQQREFVETVGTSGEALRSLVDDLLDFSRTDAGKLELENIDTDVRSLAEGVAGLLAPEAHDKGVEFILDVASSVPARLRCDPARLRQVLLNLVANAIKFTTAGEVGLRVRATVHTAATATLRWEIWDSGIGIALDKQASLFDAFVQADSSTTRRFGGTGLGLTIAKQLVEHMGGQIGIDSVPNAGSTFWFTVELEKAPGSPPAAQIPHRLANRRVLVVDDNLAQRQALDALLTGWACEVEQSDSAPRAMHRIDDAIRRGVPFDLALVDCDGPEAPGLRLLELLKTRPGRPTPTLVAMVPVTTRERDPCAAGAALAAVLSKPIKKAAMQHTLIVALSEASGGGAEGPERTAAVTRPTRTALRVLVVDDAEVNRLVAQRLLQSRGLHEVTLARSGSEALELAGETCFDLILMDLHMPDMDGCETTRRLRANNQGATPSDVYVVALTAHTNKDAQDLCEEAGMDAFLGKPIRGEELDVRLDACAALGDTHSGEQVGSKTNAGVGTGALQSQDSLFDDRVLLERVGGDQSLVAEIIATYLDDTRQRIDRMLGAVRSGDMALVGHEAHAIKGASANVGAVRAERLAHGLQTACDAGASEGLSAAVAELVQVFDATAHQIRGA